MPEGVEAIRLGGRPGDVADHEPHPRVFRGDSGNRFDRGAIVRIGADVKAIVRRTEPRERGAQHRSDHRRFVPCGHEHGEPTRNGACRIFGERSVAIAHARRAEPPPRPHGQKDEIDREIVDPADQETHACEQHGFARDRVKHGKTYSRYLQRLTPESALTIL